jgi:hypothetical protein
MKESKTPLQQYKTLKKNFLTKYSNDEIWGNWFSGKRLRAFSDLRDYLQKTEELVRLDEELEDMIDEETVNLLLGKMIPLPKTLRESMMESFEINSESYGSKYFYGSKYCALRGNLDYETRILARTLRDLSQSPNFSFDEGLANDNDEHDRVDYCDEDWFEDTFDIDCENVSEISLTLYDVYMKNQLKEFPEKSTDVLYFDKENFAARLRWLRWKIYQMIRNKISTSDDVEKYEELVQKFIFKFQSSQLSDWEVSIWRNKVLQTKFDAHEGIFRNNSEASENFSEVSSQDLSLQSDQELDAEEVNENKPEVDSVAEFFDMTKVYEHICSNLPDVPVVDDLDEEIEQRLTKLKERDENDVKAVLEKSESLKNEKGFKIPLQVEIDVKETESRNKNIEVKDFKSDIKKVDVFEGKTEAMENVKIPVSSNSVQTEEESDIVGPNKTDVFDTAKKEFNDWYESQLKMNERKPKVRVPDEPPGHNLDTENIYMQKVYENREYMQLFTSSRDNDSKRVPDLVCFLQAYLVLLISTCKTLNEQIDLFSKLSQSSPPLLPYPVQPTPLSPRSLCPSKTESSCVCVMAGSAITRSVAKVAGVTSSASVWCEWLKVTTWIRLKNLTVNVRHSIARAVVSENENFELVKLKQTRIVNVNNSS